MKNGMLASLQRRFAEIEETYFLILATLLDSHFKDKSFSDVTFLHFLKSQYISELEDCQLEEPPSKRIATLTGGDSTESSSVWG